MIVIRVIGTPGPQGSKRFLGTRGGKGILVESSAKVKPWREAVVSAAMDAMEDGALSLERHCNGGMRGAIHLDVTFTLRRPKSLASPKKAHVRPATKPDLSKLVRSTEDALTSAGAWEDDSRVVSTASRKVYPGQHPDALKVPGAVIRISEARA